MEMLFRDLNTFWTNNLRKHREEYSQASSRLSAHMILAFLNQTEIPETTWKHDNDLQVFEQLSQWRCGNNSSITRGHNFKLFEPHTLTRVNLHFLPYELSMTGITT